MKINIELCMKIIHKFPSIKSLFQRNTYLLVNKVQNSLWKFSLWIKSQILRDVILIPSVVI
jgi:hypothetical protein